MPGPLSRWLARGRALPWARLYFYGMWIYRKGRAAHGSLSASERSELGRLLKKSRGQRRNLTRGELERLRGLVGQALAAARKA